MSDLTLRLWHTLTAYHLRDRFGKKPSRIMICSCGWKPWWVRKIARTSRLRRVLVCLPTGGHVWDDEFQATVGPAGAPDEEFEPLGNRTRQCDKCYAIKDVPA